MSDSKPKLLLLGKINQAHEEWNAVGTIANIITPKSTNRTEFIAESLSGAFDGTKVIYRTFTSFKITGKLDSELISSLPSSVRFICHTGAGYDQIDIEACNSRGILVSNTPTAVDDATADTTVFLMIGALRLFNPGMARVRRGEWIEGCHMGRDPQGLVLGILGLGGIGRAVKKRTDMMGFEETIYHNRNRLDDNTAIGARWVEFEELLRTADVLSVHLPLNDETRHMISTHEFNKMKPGVVIVNTARGAVIDEDALVTALENGIVSSAGLDVFEHEPKVHPGLIANENVVLVPHMGTYSYQSLKKMECWCIENVKMGLTSGKLKSVVPEQRGMQ